MQMAGKRIAETGTNVAYDRHRHNAE